MRIAYITDYDSSSRRHWSGSGFAIRETLKRNGCDIIPYTCRNTSFEESILKLRVRAFHRMDRQLYMSYHDPLRSRLRSRRIASWLRRQRAIDWVFSPGTLQTAFLKTRVPMASWSDATFHSLSETYPDYQPLSARGRRHGDLIEKAFMHRSRSIIFASDWAYQDALCYYGSDPESTHVVPFGANVESPDLKAPGKDQIRARMQKPRFLFVGVDWQRKGGDFTVSVVDALRRQGCPAQLLIVGTEPPSEVKALPWVESIGFIDKESVEGRARLDALFAEAFALLVPSVAECYGLVYCEACAFACPPMARDVGGISTIITHGVNGLLFEETAQVEDCAKRISRLLEEEAEYLSMCCRAWDSYEERLNWDSAGKAVHQILTEALR